nr:MAG TPA: hypothetical protein [Caudoviricetes sp.]
MRWCLLLCYFINTLTNMQRCRSYCELLTAIN